MASDASGRPRKQRRQPAPTARQAARKGLAGPSTDPATNLLLTDIALRGANVFARLAIEHALLRNRYDATTAKAIIAKRGLGKRVLSLGMSRIAARSLSGALLVGGGMMGKIMLDRARANRQARIAAARTARDGTKADPDGA